MTARRAIKQAIHDDLHESSLHYGRTYAKLHQVFERLEFTNAPAMARHIIFASAPGSNIHQVEDRRDCLDASTVYSNIGRADIVTLVLALNDVTIETTNQELRLRPPDDGRVLLILDVHQHTHSVLRLPPKANPKSRRAKLQRVSKTNTHLPFATNFLALQTAWRHKGRFVGRPTALFPVGSLQGTLAQHAKLAGQVARRLAIPGGKKPTAVSPKLGIDVPADRHYDAPSFMNALTAEGLDPLVRLKGPTNNRLTFISPTGEKQRLESFVAEAAEARLEPNESVYKDRSGRVRRYDYFPFTADVTLAGSDETYRLFLKVSVQRVAGNWVPYKEDSMYLLGRASNFHLVAFRDFYRRWEIEIRFLMQALAESDPRPENSNHEYLMLWMAQWHAFTGQSIKDDYLDAAPDEKARAVVGTMGAVRMSWLAHGLVG